MDNTSVPADAKTKLLDECESLWTQMQEAQHKLTLPGKQPILNSDDKVSLLIMQVKSLLEELHQWQKRTPEVVSSGPDVLVALGKQELQKAKSDLETLLSALQSKDKQLEEALKREQQYYNEQKRLVCILDKIEEEAKKQVNPCSSKSVRVKESKIKNKTQKVKLFKEHLLNEFCEFLRKHFSLPEEAGIAEKKKSNENPSVKLNTLQEMLEILVDKIISTPHEPYVEIRESFWQPYIELLLRSGIALRHPEDPNRIRLEAFHM